MAHKDVVDLFRMAGEDVELKVLKVHVSFI